MFVTFKYFKQISFNLYIEIICPKITQVISEGVLQFCINAGLKRGCDLLIIAVKYAVTTD